MIDGVHAGGVPNLFYARTATSLLDFCGPEVAADSSIEPETRPEKTGRVSVVKAGRSVDEWSCTFVEPSVIFTLQKAIVRFCAQFGEDLVLAWNHL